ncbi:MAG: putative short-chain dehydrogenase/reductase SDR [Leptospirillum rubarum]|nr:MAG: putative short-chain dehydrogenase/reductase SDR [Leptospirillum rubarum]
MKSKVALITGANGGLGEFLVRRFWDAGYSLCLVARNERSIMAISSSLPKRNDQNVSFFACDLSDPVLVVELTKTIRKHHQRLDVLVNNAATHGPIGPLWESDLQAWQRTIQVNLLSPVALCRAFVPWMKENGGGSIINVSGGGATGPRANFSAYATSKGALVRFSETLAEETRLLGIRVNCIAPGAMKTRMLAEVIEKGAIASGNREFAIAEKVYSEGGASMDRVADLALFLASDASDGITGKLISAVWDPWEFLAEYLEDLKGTDIYTLRRIVPKDRGKDWGNDA